MLENIFDTFCNLSKAHLTSEKKVHSVLKMPRARIVIISKKYFCEFRDGKIWRPSEWRLSPFWFLKFESVKKQRRHSSEITKQKLSGWSKFLSSKAHWIWPKVAQKGAQKKFLKKSHIFGKRRTIFDPPNNFYCIFIHKFFGVAKFFKKYI